MSGAIPPLPQAWCLFKKRKLRDNLTFTFTLTKLYYGNKNVGGMGGTCSTHEIINTNL
jgi:hypothetical protein